MNFRDFIEEFENWRANNGYPKREECREFFRTYRDLKESNKTYEPIECFEYILSQQKPAMFLDTLFKRDGEIAKRDKLRAEQTEPQRNYKAEIIDAVYNEYEASRDEISSDVDEILSKLRSINAIEE